MPHTLRRPFSIFEPIIVISSETFHTSITTTQLPCQFMMPLSARVLCRCSSFLSTTNNHKITVSAVQRGGQSDGEMSKRVLMSRIDRLALSPDTKGTRTHTDVPLAAGLQHSGHILIAYNDTVASSVRIQPTVLEIAQLNLDVRHRVNTAGMYICLYTRTALPQHSNAPLHICKRNRVHFLSTHIHSTGGRKATS